MDDLDPAPNVLQVDLNVSTLVLGSRPAPRLPRAETVVFANGSIGLSDLVGVPVKNRFHVMTDYVLVANDREPEREACRGASVNTLFLIRAAANDATRVADLADLNYSAQRVVDITPRQRMAITVGVCRLNGYRHIVQGHGTLRSQLGALVRGRELDAKASTGVFALLLAIWKNLGVGPYCLAGIGFDATGHFYDQQYFQKRDWRRAHTEIDRHLLSGVADWSGLRPSVVTTEPELAAIVGLPLAPS